MSAGASDSWRTNLSLPHGSSTATRFLGCSWCPDAAFYNLLSIAYGADQATFGDLADHQHLTETRALFQGHLPEGRARGCRIEFGELNFAFQHLIKPHIDE